MGSFPETYIEPKKLTVLNTLLKLYLKMCEITCFPFQIQADQGFKPTDLKTTILEMAYNLIDAGFVKKTQKFEEVKGKLAVKS